MDLHDSITIKRQHYRDIYELSRLCELGYRKDDLLFIIIWMFHDRFLNAKVNKIHERVLRIVYKDIHADYETLLKLDNAVSVHHRNLQYLMMEICRSKNSLNPSFITEFFKPRDIQYNLRNKNTLDIPKITTTSYGIETVQ